jgi:predicted Zn-dependent protease with MMP-like domain
VDFQDIDLAALPKRVGKRRDRHGRGPRGPIVPPALPGARSKAAVFDRCVERAIARLERSWPDEMGRIDVTVEDVPLSDPATWEHGLVPLGRCFPGRGQSLGRIVLYRRPMEERAYDSQDLGIGVLDALVQQVAALLGRAPEEIDPGYGEY